MTAGKTILQRSPHKAIRCYSFNKKKFGEAAGKILKEQGARTLLFFTCKNNPFV